MSGRRPAREDKHISEDRRRKMVAVAKIGRALGLAGAAVFFGYGAYWLSIPGGEVVAVGMFIAGAVIAIEAYRIFRVR